MCKKGIQLENKRLKSKALGNEVFDWLFLLISLTKYLVVEPLFAELKNLGKSIIFFQKRALET